eukprot:6173053-Pleurochrysis_carterae.AAC.3
MHSAAQAANAFALHLRARVCDLRCADPRALLRIAGGWLPDLHHTGTNPPVQHVRTVLRVRAGSCKSRFPSPTPYLSVRFSHWLPTCRSTFKLAYASVYVWIAPPGRVGVTGAADVRREGRRGVRLALRRRGEDHRRRVHLDQAARHCRAVRWVLEEGGRGLGMCA